MFVVAAFAFYVQLTSSPRTHCIFVGCPQNGQLDHDTWKKQDGRFSSLRDCQALCDHRQDCNLFSSNGMVWLSLYVQNVTHNKSTWSYLPSIFVAHILKRNACYISFGRPGNIARQFCEESNSYEVYSCHNTGINSITGCSLTDKRRILRTIFIMYNL